MFLVIFLCLFMQLLIGYINLPVLRFKPSQHQPLESLRPQCIDDRVRAAVEDGDGVGRHAQDGIVGVVVEQLDLPPDHVGHVAHGQDERHDGDGRRPPFAPFTLKERVQGDPSGWLKPPVDIVPTVLAAGGPLL